MDTMVFLISFGSNFSCTILCILLLYCIVGWCYCQFTCMRSVVHIHRVFVFESFRTNRTVMQRTFLSLLLSIRRSQIQIIIAGDIVVVHIDAIVVVIVIIRIMIWRSFVFFRCFGRLCCGHTIRSAIH